MQLKDHNTSKSSKQKEMMPMKQPKMAECHYCHLKNHPSCHTRRQNQDVHPCQFREARICENYLHYDCMIKGLNSKLKESGIKVSDSIMRKYKFGGLYFCSDHIQPNYISHMSITLLPEEENMTLQDYSKKYFPPDDQGRMKSHDNERLKDIRNNVENSYFHGRTMDGYIDLLKKQLKKAQSCHHTEWIQGIKTQLSQRNRWKKVIDDEVKAWPIGEVNLLMYDTTKKGRFGTFTAKVGKNGNIQELSYSWVHNVFHWRYIVWVKSKANIWHDVPVGKSREDRLSLPKCGHINFIPSTHNYPQMWLRQDKGQDVCAYASMASALFHSGDNETAVKMKEQVTSGNGIIMDGKSRDAFLKILRSSQMFQLKIHNKMDLRMFMKYNSGVVTSALLIGSDGGSNHCVATWNHFLFDSNCSHAVPLTEIALNWCVDCNEEGTICVGVKNVYELIPKNPRKFRRKKRNWMARKKRKTKREQGLHNVDMRLIIV